MRQFIFIVCLFITFLFPLTIKAEEQIAVNIFVSEDNKATLEISYPIVSVVSQITILPTNNTGKSFDASIILLNAKSDAGEERQITDQGSGSDATVEVKYGDRFIIVTYSLNNFIKSDNIGVFNFPLIFGNTFPGSVLVSMKKADTMETIFPISRDPLTNIDRNSFHLIADGNTREYTSRELMFFTYYKGNYSTYEKREIGKYVLVGPKNKIQQFYKAVSDLGFVDKMFHDLFGLSDREKTIMLLFPFSKQGILMGGYEAGLALSPVHTIFLDVQPFSFQKSSTLAKRVIIHELTHLLLGSKNGPFMNQKGIKWMDEGLAVFASEYASDNNDFPKSDIVSLPFGNRKFTLEELKSAYSHDFDFNFLINTKDHMIVETYTHAGLIFYNLFLRDSNYIKQLISLVKNNSYNNSCPSCNDQFVLEQIKKITGMSEQEILYPFKDNLSGSNTTLPVLTMKDVDINTQQKTKEILSKTVGSYTTEGAPVESSVISNNKQIVNKTSGTTSPQEFKGAGDPENQQDLLIEKVKQKNVQPEKTLSFFEKVMSWVVALFK